MDFNNDLIEVLSTAEIDAIEQEVAQLPDRESAAIEALRIVQQHRGWVSDASLNAIAEQLQMSVATLDSIATFYNLIFRQQVGRHVVMLCNSVSCYVMGGDAACTKVCHHLGIELGETTADGRFTLLPIVCLGACDRAPAMIIDDQLIGNIDTQSLDETLSRFD